MKTFDIGQFAKAVCHDERTLEMFRYFVNNAYVRVVRYYDTPAVNSARFEAEIAYFNRHFSTVTLEDVDIFFATRRWPKEKPGLIPVLLEGYRNHHTVMAPILERYGFVGWYFIPSGFIDTPVGQQASYGRKHGFVPVDARSHRDGRIAMSWEEIEQISRRHVICCNTASNAILRTGTPDEEMQREIMESKRTIESHIDREVRVFHWLRAEEFNYNVRAHHLLELAGYTYVLSNLKLEKIR